MTAKTQWKVERVLQEDVPALARNNMSAFWEDPNWIVVWPKGTKLETLIDSVTKRFPAKLVKDRVVVRHQKAVDPETGKFVGYARWVLPPSHVTTADGQPAWAAAQTFDVSSEEQKRLDKVAESAWWETREMGGIDDKNHEIERRILAEKPYLKLDYIAVHPENKGKGIATALVKSGIAVARELGIDTFILAFEAGRPVYEKLGFREVDRNIEDDSPYGGPGRYAAYFMILDTSKKDEEPKAEST